MQNPRLAARYAKSLLDLAVEQNSLEATLGDMQLLDRICKSNSQFTSMLRSPVINSDKKSAIINAVWADKVTNPLTQSFVSLLIKKGREISLDEIASAFIAQYKIFKNIKTVQITTAVPMDENVKKHILGKVAAAMKTESLDVKTHVDPDLIGGFILEMDGRQLDASVRTELNNIKNKFVDYSYTVQL